MLEKLYRDLRGVGLSPDYPLLEGGRQRCKVEGDKGAAKSGWYVIYSARNDDNEPVYVGAWGNWRTREKGALFSGGRELTRREKDSLNKKIKAEKEKAEQRRQEEARRAAIRARAAWAAMRPCSEHPYLTRKRVGAYGVRMNGRGDLAIPAQNAAGELVGLQIVFSEKSEKLGRDKTFWPTGFKKGKKQQTALFTIKKSKKLFTII